MKNRMVCLRALFLSALFLLFAAVVFGTFLKGEAPAQVRPAIVRDIDNGDRMEIVNTALTPVFLNPGDQIEEACKSTDVPAGKRLVITHVSARLIVPTGQSAQAMFRATDAGSQYLLAVPQGKVDADRDLYVVSEAIRWVIGPGGHLCFQMGRYPADGNATGFFNYIGYYIDAP